MDCAQDQILHNRGLDKVHGAASGIGAVFGTPVIVIGVEDFLFIRLGERVGHFMVWVSKQASGSLPRVARE